MLVGEQWKVVVKNIYIKSSLNMKKRFMDEMNVKE
jgi:hypothetical protein